MLQLTLGRGQFLVSRLRLSQMIVQNLSIVNSENPVSRMIEVTWSVSRMFVTSATSSAWGQSVSSSGLTFLDLPR